MTAEIFALGVAGAVFAGGAVGLLLQARLPEKYTTGGPRDMIGGVVGLLTLLSALVLGLLIWTAYGVYSSQNLAVQNLASRILQLDLDLEDYGPEAAPERAELRRRLSSTIDQIWGHQDSDAELVALHFGRAAEIMRDSDKAFASLHPATDEQKRLLAADIQTVGAIGQARLQMALALTDPVSYPLVLIVVGWAVFLFFGFGLMSKHNLMSFAAVAVGALAVSTAIYLIMDLSAPYSGVFRISPAPLEQVLAYMNKP